MPKLSAAVAEAIQQRRIEVIYLSRIHTNWWNARRTNGDVAMFTGWYWIAGNREAGPFKSRSAAVRDAYYNVVHGGDAPTMSRTQRNRAIRDHGA